MLETDYEQIPEKFRKELEFIEEEIARIYGD